MTQTIAICTHKGGAAKTVTSLALAAGLARAGHRCLLIDLDPQGHSTLGLGVETNEPTLKDFFERHPSMPLSDVVQTTSAIELLDVAPSDLRLAWTAEALAGRPKREELLSRSLRPLVDTYEWIIIDTPPSLGVLTQNAVTAASYILIPTVAEARATDAIVDILELVQLMKGEGFDQYGILLARMDGRKTRTNATVISALEPWKKKILRTRIPQSEALNQAQMARQDIYTFDPSGPGAIAYEQLTRELASL